MLALLSADATVDTATVARVAADITAHLKTEQTLLYPIVERAWRRPLVEQRALDDHMHQLLSKVTRSSDRDTRRMHLKDLDAAFREHSRLFERAALPWIEAASPASLDALRRQLGRLEELSRQRATTTRVHAPLTRLAARRSGKR